MTSGKTALLWKWAKGGIGLGTGIAAWWALGIGLGAQGWFRPFDLRASIGAPILQTVESGGRKVVSLAVPISLSNGGAASGCVVDVALKLRDNAIGSEWAFFAVYFLEASLYDYRHEPVVKPVIAGPPTAVRLGGNETVTKAMWFLPRPPRGLQPLDVTQLRTGQVYAVTLYAVSSAPGCELSHATGYRELARDEIDLKPEHLKGLREGKPVQPTMQALDGVRDRFVSER